MLHIFDLDHTLIKKNISVSFGAYLFRKKEFSVFKMLYLLSLYTLHKCKLISLRQLHEMIFYKLFWEQTAIHFYEEAENFLNQELDQLLGPSVLEKLRQASGKTALLSSSPDFLVEAVAKRLSVDFFMGSLYKVDQRGRFIQIESVVDGKSKAERAKALSLSQNVSLSNVTAYSDSYLDIPLLEIVGHPIAVNPDKILLEECHKRKWTILISAR